LSPRKTLPTLALLIVLALTALIWFYPPNGDFITGNQFWNGLSTFTTDSKVSIITSFDSLPSPSKETGLIVIPYAQFTETELDELSRYVSEGGALIVLDDYGYGNQILNRLGLNMRFTGKPLLDPLFDYKNKWLPRITDFTQTPIVNNITSIVLNHASTISNVSDNAVLANSSRFSFLDLNSDSTWETDDPMGPLPVAAYAKVGGGYVVAVSDPSFLINGMINMDDNLNFIKKVTQIQSSSPTIFLDQSHLPRTNLDDAKETISAAYDSASSPLGTLSLIIIILALALTPIWRKSEKNEQTSTRRTEREP
jgi:hypothetical protein